ncbi:hypothetical protein Ndes2526B_g01875 [Nannochloris sp. 'desiccata']
MGRLFVEYIEEGCGSKYACKCGLDVAGEESLVWEGIMGSNHPALLFRRSVNLDSFGPKREECLSTGKYVLQDVACRACSANLGWKYVHAEAQDQKYKEHCLLLKLEELQRVNRVAGNCITGRLVNSSSAGTARAIVSGGTFHRNVQQPVYNPHGSRLS